MGNVRRVYVEKKEPYQRDVNTVFQNYALFPNMNVFDNVAYGLKVKKVPKDEIKERVLHMLKLVQLEGFEKRRITQMSGGQKQRISIARVFLKNPPILILDEATSALDSISEKKIQDSIQKLVKGRTTLIVAHRLSTIRNADRIAVIEKGNVLECGSYEELIEKKGAFYRMEKM